MTWRGRGSFRAAEIQEPRQIGMLRGQPEGIKDGEGSFGEQMKQKSSIRSPAYFHSGCWLTPHFRVFFLLKAR